MHPQINEALDLYNTEPHPFTKVHRMIDLFEIIIKTHSAYIISDYFRIMNVSDEIKGLLAEGLITPSLGIWQVFSREIMDDLVFPKELLKDSYNEIMTRLEPNQKETFSKLYLWENDVFKLSPTILTKRRKTIHKIVKNSNFAFSKLLFLPSFYSYFFEWDKQISNEFTIGNKKIPNPIELRNKYAHGATPDSNICMEDINNYQAVLDYMLAAEWLHNTTIVVFAKKNGTFQRIPFLYDPTPFPLEEQCQHAIKQYKKLKENSPYLLNSKGELLSLFPIITFKEIREKAKSTLFFFNDLKKIKKQQISLLNYPNSYHLIDSDIYEEFLSVINVIKWKNKIHNVFKDIIQELTDNFQGRVEEQTYMNRFIETRIKGILFVFGSPGIGKSALIATVINNLKIPYRQGNLGEANQEYYVVEYFIRRNSIFAKPIKMLDALSRQLEDVCRTKIPYGNTLEEKQDYLDQRLRIISTHLGNQNQKVIILIDGIDEGIDGRLHHYLFTQSYPNILFIYSSRLTSEVESLYLKTQIEVKDKLILNGLNANDIRALLYEVSNKYALMKNDSSVDTILNISSGNPLYLKLLCAEIEKGSISIDNLECLPERIGDFYEEILSRFKADESGHFIIRALYIFAIGHDFLNTKQMEIILGTDSVEAELIMEKLSEVLYEHPGLEGSFQLFHESFREYLVKTRLDQLIDAEWDMVRYCLQWQTLDSCGEIVHSYPLLHFSKHLLRLGAKELLDKLVENEQYLESQIQLTKNFEPSFQLYLDALELAKDDEKSIIDILEKIALLHCRIGNQVPKVLDSLAANTNGTGYALEMAEQLKGVEKFLLYIHLIYHTVHHQLLTQKEKHNQLQEIFYHYDENADTNVIGFKWTDYMSLRFMVKLLVQVRKLGVNVMPVLLRSDLQNMDHDTMEFELSGFDLTDLDTFEICAGLFLTNIYEPCLKSWCTLLSKQHLFEQALEIAKQINIPEIRVDALGQIAYEQQTCGKTVEALQTVESAEKYAREINVKYIQVAAFCAIAYWYYQLSKCELSKQYLHDVIKKVSDITDYRNRSFAYREIANVIFKSKKPEGSS
jgi:hypothetical protein